MKFRPTERGGGRGERAWALMAVMCLSILGMAVLTGVMSWSQQNFVTTARDNELFATAYAADAATEKALSRMSQDFQNYGNGTVSSNLSAYATAYPSCPGSPEGGNFSSYLYSGGGVANQIIVALTAITNQITLNAPYTGLTLNSSTYEIIATAVNTNSTFYPAAPVTATIGQQLNMGYIPLFQFAIFYQDQLEIEPNAPMTISGTVHCNSNIYIAPQNGITFSNDVTASGSIALGTYSASDPITFDALDEGGVPPLDLPVGTNTTGSYSNSSQNVHAILDLPQVGQTPNSPTGSNLFYNQADMIIVISNNGTVNVTAGAGLPTGANTPITNWQAFMNTNGTFEDQRDGLNVYPVTINVSNLVQWSATNTVLAPLLQSARGAGQSDVQSIYIDDLRTFTNTTQVITTNEYTTNVSETVNSSNESTMLAPVTITAIGKSPVLPPANDYANATTKLIPLPGPPPELEYSTTYNPVVWTTIYTTNYATNIITNTVTNTISELAGQPGIVLSNGAVLPPQGLSIATPDPAYVIGNWNVQLTNGGTSDAGLTNNTTYSQPSAIFSDALTVLSSAWNPANSASSISNRMAVSDTLNAAILTGNVPTTVSDGSTNYSGGVENLPRMLENWTGQTFTYNGSMVCMFPSQVATEPYPYTGAVFQPPSRNWAYDQSFSSRPPPLTPKAIMVQRTQWVWLAPNATSF